MTEEHQIRCAIAAHHRRSKRLGAIPQEPSPACSEIDGGVVILRNRYRELGQYRFIEGRNRFECLKEAEP